MPTDFDLVPAHPEGEPILSQSEAGVPAIRADPLAVDTVGGRVHVEWDANAPVTPMGQLVFFAQFLKTANLFDPWVRECPLRYTSPNAPEVRDVLGTTALSILAGHHRYTHITALRHDLVNPPLLGMSRILSEDA